MHSAAGDLTTSVPLTDVLTRKSNALQGGPHFGSNSPCTQLNASQMPGDCPGGDGRFWNWLVHYFSSHKCFSTLTWHPARRPQRRLQGPGRLLNSRISNVGASPRLDARKIFPIVSHEKVYFSSTKQWRVTKQEDITKQKLKCAMKMFTKYWEKSVYG